jgi:hypothetical protein
MKSPDNPLKANMDSEAEAGVMLAARQLAEESTTMCDTLPVLSENEADKHTDIGLQLRRNAPSVLRT